MRRRIAGMRRRWRLLALTMGVAFSGCSSTGPDTGIDGTFILVKFNDLPVPANWFQLPDINGLPTSCWKSVSEGSLTLSVATLTYQLAIVYRDSCNGHVLESVQTGGRFEESGNTLTLFLGVLNGEEVIPTTHVGNIIGITPDSDTYYFRKQ